MFRSKVVHYEILQIFAAFLQNTQEQNLFVGITLNDAIAYVENEIVDVTDKGNENIIAEKLEHWKRDFWILQQHFKNFHESFDQLEIMLYKISHFFLGFEAS